MKWGGSSSVYAKLEQASYENNEMPGTNLLGPMHMLFSEYSIFHEIQFQIDNSLHVFVSVYFRKGVLASPSDAIVHLRWLFVFWYEN